MSAEQFLLVLRELVDENPFAIRAVLRILEVVFTEEVPTLAVTCEARPRLLVNLAFLGQHCRSESQVKAVVCHEFLHVLLRHTEEPSPLTPARHLALDAVINAIIHRQYGPAYSDMMATYYADARGLERLLRPMNRAESTWFERHRYPGGQLPQWAQAWGALYAGQLVADDVEALATELSRARCAGRNQSADRDGGKASARRSRKASAAGPFQLEDSAPPALGDLLGNHEDLERPLPDALQSALDQSVKQMNGAGIWRAPKARGVGANPYDALVRAQNEPLARWQRRTLEVLKAHLVPDPNSRQMREEWREYQVPVLSPSDRRAFLRALWAPYLPEATWRASSPRPVGTAQVYLDVSGSMSAEMPLVVALLGRLARYIRRPFWAFSDEVAPAVIVGGQLQTRTSGGTSLSCVIEHLARTRPSAAVVVTDGYVEPLQPAFVRQAAGTRLHALVTRDGNPDALRRAGIPHTQLDRVPA